MTFLPVVERELRVRARNRRLYWGRMLAAQAALGLTAWVWLTLARGASTELGSRLFTALSFASFGYCLLLGAFLTADSVSEEKREGTLGLLFLTDLKGYDVALGKLAANSLQALYNLIAIFPILTIPLLLGGLTGAEVFRMSLVLLASLIFSLTAGLLVSTLSRHDRKAQAGAFALVLAVTAGAQALGAWLKLEHRLAVPDALFAASPGYALGYALDRAFAAKPGAFWLSLGLVTGLSWLAFILSAVFIRRVWQDRPAEGGPGGWRGAYQRWKRGSAEARKKHREDLLGVNPCYWLAARDRWRQRNVLRFLALSGAVWLVLWLAHPRDMLEPEAFFLTAIVLHTILKVWLASEAGRQFFEDRQSSALELTLSTPLTVREVIEGQCLALLRQFGPAIALVLIFDVTAMILGSRDRGSDRELVLLGWISMAVLLVADAAVITALGMWLGLTARRFSHALARLLFLVLALPWILFLGVITCLAFTRTSGLNSLSYVITLYLVISLVTGLVLFLNASGSLAARFREMAARRSA